MLTRLIEKLRLCLITVCCDPERNTQPLLYPFGCAALLLGDGHTQPLRDCAVRFPQRQWSGRFGRAVRPCVEVSESRR